MFYITFVIKHLNKTKSLTFICLMACLVLLTLPFVLADDEEAPVVDDISHSAELAGATCNFGMTATDATELDSYIFYFDNGVGDFTADPKVAFTPLQTEETVNVTKTPNTDDGVTIRWKWYANDTLGFEDTTEEYSFVTTPTEAQAAGNAALANYWIALGLVAIIPLIMGAVGGLFGTLIIAIVL